MLMSCVPLFFSFYTNGRCWADGVVPKDEDYAKGSLRAAMNEKNWGALGSGMSLIGVSNFAD
jgi:hypothetical protein